MTKFCGKPDFVAIDFETAIAHQICAVAVVSVKDRQIVDEFYTLVRPKGNRYSYHNSQVHGITAADTFDAPSFAQVFRFWRGCCTQMWWWLTTKVSIGMCCKKICRRLVWTIVG